MKYCLVADDGEAQVVVRRTGLRRVKLMAHMMSEGSTCKFHVCRREPSPNGEHRVIIETWEKGKRI